jgi:hypothetical protein
MDLACALAIGALAHTTGHLVCEQRVVSRLQVPGHPLQEAAAAVPEH